MSYALIADFLQDRQSFKFFIRHRHQHIKPSASIIAKVHILKADIFTLEKPDISILGLHKLLEPIQNVYILTNKNV
ncbi:hypothetical protein CWI32_14605 [Acinetobacter pseudolwoffii]|uniref:Uncharacterized protein n=1 Tax=Acinetobacter pseudolwoffii TaxID=2053287 RepID=A0A2H9YNG2_9GAMM|nr:hypothetical protein CWI32_14605 [Acinetobacter pseudolwoffii]